MLNEEDVINEDLYSTVEADTGLKALVTEYVGNRLLPVDNQVTLDMVIEVFAMEFPEFLLPVAEENFIRGYKQAMNDLDNSKDIFAGLEDFVNAITEE